MIGLKIESTDSGFKISGTSVSLDSLGQMLRSAAKLRENYNGTLTGHGCGDVRVVCTEKLADLNVYSSGQVADFGDIVRDPEGFIGEVYRVADGTISVQYRDATLYWAAHKCSLVFRK